MIRRVRVADVIDHNVERANLRAELLDVISILPARERIFIERHYLRGETLKEIGASVRRSRERIRQIMERGLRKLRRDVEYGRL